MTKQPSFTSHESILSTQIAILLEEILLRLPKSYSEEDSSVEYPLSYAHGEDNDGPERPGLGGGGSYFARKARVLATIHSGAYIPIFQRERERAIEREETEGNHSAAQAVRVTTEDVKTCARKTMEWIADHAEMTKGKLTLGRFEESGIKCEVNAKVNGSGPSIDFEIDCQF